MGSMLARWQYSLLRAVAGSRAGQAVGILGVLAALGHYGAETHRHVEYWRSSLHLWRRTVDVNPLFTEAHADLGKALYVKSSDGTLAPEEAKAVAGAALQCFDEALRLNPAAPKVLLQRGNLYRQGILDGSTRPGQGGSGQGGSGQGGSGQGGSGQGGKETFSSSPARLADAIKSYRDALALKPDYVAAYGNLGGTLRRSADLIGKRTPGERHDRAVYIAESVRAYERAVELEPNTAQYLSGLASVLVMQGADALPQERNQNRGSPGASLVPQQHQQHRQQRATAATAATATAAAATTTTTTTMPKRNTVRSDEEADKARQMRQQQEDAARKAAEANSPYYRALQLYARASAQAPDDPEISFNYANALRIVRSPDGWHTHRDQAIEQYRRTLALKPDYVNCMINMGVTLTQMGRPSEAAGLLEKAVPLSGNPRTKQPSPVVLYNLADALDKSGERAKALQVFRTAKRVEPRYAQLFPQLATEDSDEDDDDDA